MTVTSAEAASVQYFIVMALLFVAVLASRTSAEPQLDVGYYPFATESLQEMPEICYELGPVGKAMLLVMYGALFLVAAPCVFHEFASNMVQFSIAWFAATALDQLYTIGLFLLSYGAVFNSVADLVSDWLRGFALGLLSRSNPVPMRRRGSSMWMIALFGMFAVPGVLAAAGGNGASANATLASTAAAGLGIAAGASVARPRKGKRTIAKALLVMKC